MRKFNFNLLGGVPYYLEDFDFVQENMNLQDGRIFQGIADLANVEIIIISGCNETVNGLNTDVSPGYMWLNGRIYRFPGGSYVTADEFNYVVDYDVNTLVNRQLQNSQIEPVWIEHSAKLVTSPNPGGNISVEWFLRIRLEDALFNNVLNSQLVNYVRSNLNQLNQAALIHAESNFKNKSISYNLGSWNMQIVQQITGLNTLNSNLYKITGVSVLIESDNGITRDLVEDGGWDYILSGNVYSFTFRRNTGGYFHSSLFSGSGNRGTLNITYRDV